MSCNVFQNRSTLCLGVRLLFIKLIDKIDDDADDDDDDKNDDGDAVVVDDTVDCAVDDDEDTLVLGLV